VRCEMVMFPIKRPSFGSEVAPRTLKAQLAL